MARTEAYVPSNLPPGVLRALDGARHFVRTAGNKEANNAAQTEMKKLFAKAKKLFAAYPDPEGMSTTRDDNLTPLYISNFRVHDEDTHKQIGEKIVIMGNIYPYHSLEKAGGGTPLFSLYQPTTESGEPNGDIQLFNFTETFHNKDRTIPSARSLTDLKDTLNYIEETHIARPWREQYLSTR